MKNKNIFIHIKFFVFITIIALSGNSAVADDFHFVGTPFPQILNKKDNGEIGGLGPEIVRTIAEKLGHGVKIQVVPFSRALSMIENGQADAFIGPYKNAKREKYMQYSKLPFYQDQISFYSKKDNSFIWNGDFSSLKGMNIGINRGWSYGSDFDRAKKNLAVYNAETLKANFQKLLNNRIDLFVCHPRGALSAISKLKIADKIQRLLPPITVNNGYFAFSRKRKIEKFINAFDAEIDKMVANGELAKLRKKHKVDDVE